MPWNPAAKHMAKLDDLGKQATDRFRATKNADASSSMSDRFKAATSGAGQTSIGARWDREMAARKATDGDQSQATETPSPPPAPARRAAPAAQPFPSRPPPPPQRNGLASPPPLPHRNSNPPPVPGRPALPARSSGSSTNVARGGPPSLPPRMNNEGGTSHPPPPYRPVDTHVDGAPSGRDSAPPPPVRRGPPPIPTGRKPGIANGSASSPQSLATAGARPSDTSNAATSALASLNIQGSRPESSQAPISSGVSRTASSLGPLTASRASSDQPCQALSAATFFCYPASFPEWASSPPWFATSVNSSAPASLRIPPHLEHTNDRAWKASGEMQTQRRPDGTTQREEVQFGCVLFGDLSSLWYRIKFDASDPAQTFECNVAYAEPPSAWSDSALLEASAASYGELVARFCEAREGTVVGNGECWTLAHDALAQVNSEQGWPEESWALTSVGRTHGHLIYFASADAAQPARGLWRGGDVGNVRRGDILEWDGYATCKLLQPPGATASMGNPSKGWPEHTAVVVGVGRGPGAATANGDGETPFDPHDLIHLEVLDQSAGVPVARKVLDLRAGQWTKGTLHIYRPVGKDAYLDGKVEPNAWPGGQGEMSRRKGWEPLN
ncbi:unnamed protein product [Parajaminaea phylloscopi]